MEISAIIAAHNSEKYIERALRSILDQSLSKDIYEIIVVDDGSTDKTRNILRSFKDMIKIITIKKNKGLSYARNLAVKQALGRYIIFVDSDDFVSHNLLTMEREFLRNNKYMDAVSCDYYIINEKEEFVTRKSALEEPIACGIMFKKDRLIEIGLYDEKFRALEDLDLRKRYLDKFNIYNIPLPLYRYRDHDTNLTKNHKVISYHHKKLTKKHGIKDIKEKLRNHENTKQGVVECLS